MANITTKVSASPCHLTYALSGDGTLLSPVLANATILADMEEGPLKDAWNATYANQAAMRNALLARVSHCSATVQIIVSPVQTTAEQNLVLVDVDVDAVTATKAEINISMAQTTGQLAYLHLIYDHTLIQ